MPFRDVSAAGSFGTLERAWCEGRLTPPTWWAFLSSALPFELYGTDRKGLPITYLGLGRMDLSGVSREATPKHRALVLFEARMETRVLIYISRERV